MSRKPHTDERQSGFVLLEVLIAAVLAGLTLIVVLHAYSTAFGGSERSERLTIALLAAESRLAALGVSEPLEAGETSGRLGGGYRWRTEIRPYNGLPEDQLNRLPVRAYEVEVTVSWGPSAGMTITLSSLRLAEKDGYGETR